MEGCPRIIHSCKQIGNIVITPPDVVVSRRRIIEYASRSSGGLSSESSFIMLSFGNASNALFTSYPTFVGNSLVERAYVYPDPRDGDITSLAAQISVTSAGAPGVVVIIHMGIFKEIGTSNTFEQTDAMVTFTLATPLVPTIVHKEAITGVSVPLKFGDKFIMVCWQTSGPPVTVSSAAGILIE